MSGSGERSSEGPVTKDQRAQRAPGFMTLKETGRTLAVLGLTPLAVAACLSLAGLPRSIVESETQPTSSPLSC